MTDPTDPTDGDPPPGDPRDPRLPPAPGPPSGTRPGREPTAGSEPDEDLSSGDPRPPPASDPPSGTRPGREPTAAPSAASGGRTDLDRTAAAVWTLPFAVAAVVALALPWASCPGCSGPVVFTAWSLPDSDAIGTSTGAEYGLCSIGGVLALVLTVAAAATLRPALATAGSLVAAATTALAAYAIVTIVRHGLNVEAGAPVTAGGAGVLTITLIGVRSRLASGNRWRNLES